ncbi:MAG TPA: hypothetical protein DCW29_12405 [Janthinobacterium sp.]|nr:hypothetical protein [Janthinobacterium sp.]
MNAHQTTGGTAALARAGRAALQWRLLLLWAGCLLIPTLALALPLWQVFSASFDHSVRAAALASELDLMSVSDLLSNLRKNGMLFEAGGGAALILTLLLSPLLSGMVVTAARAPQVPGFGALLGGAGAEYGRMLRLLIWAAVPLGIALALGAGAMHLADKYAKTTLLEADGALAGHAALALAALLFMLASATLDAARAELTIDRRHTSAVKAWWRGLKTLCRRPLAGCGIYLVISLAGLLVVAALGLLRIRLPHAGPLGVAAAFLLTQAMALALAWMRGARLFAMVDLARRASGQAGQFAHGRLRAA